MLKTVVVGALGRMGRSIMDVVAESNAVELSGAVETSDNPYIGKDIGELAGTGKTGIRLTDDLEEAIKDAGCIIDFTLPEATIHNLEVACKYGKAFVTGTTGFSHHQRGILRDLGKKGRIVAAPNMSVGINLLLKVVADMAEVLGDDYDVEIVEAHHRLKKDAPSGTAIRLAEVLAHTLHRDLDSVATYGREGIIGKRKHDEIGILSVRAGDIVGDHTVLFGGDGERIEITHRAHSRVTFARGAVRAALWLVEQPNGLYDMQDVLGLEESL